VTDTRRDRRPRRDAGGRLATIGDLLGTVLAGLVCGMAVLLLVEGVLALVHRSGFGHTSGWLALILPVWLFTEEFRAAGFGAARVLVAGLGAGLGLALGLTFAGWAATVSPALVSGAVGALTLAVVYCLVWFYGLRWLNHRAG